MTDHSCTHTSDWWKQMANCFACGAYYSDEEAERIAGKMSRQSPNFTAEQQAIIDRLQAENIVEIVEARP